MKINYITLLGLTLATFTMSSCLKDYDPSDYAPEKPIGGYSSSKEIAPDNLVAFWSFNGNLNDSIANLSATGTNTSFTAGKKGQAYQGSANGYAVIANAGTVIPALQSYSISFWMNTTQPTKATGVFALNNSKDFWGNIDVYLESYVQKGVPNPDTAFFKVHMNNANAKWAGQFTDCKFGAAIGKWVHVGITYNGDKSIFNIYANGTQIGVNTAGNPQGTKGPILNGDDPVTNKTPYGPLKFVNAASIVFGAFQFQTNPSLGSAGAQDWATDFGGQLDEFRVYNKALSGDEINALYKLESLGR
ncbi:hypothetical protein GS399_18925 [Pedobacter sp. HMF7647]|uniref:LamG domain-containing protein n=1 Tax=Hufsiella arboris TaxID=2695275 RepID=A0A7K1YGC4_9SPHI|nr:LamG domain-containing protein [Hufsiella arboris]MXV53049.1 hypothetical protein [Hufsiella arboris]